MRKLAFLCFFLGVIASVHAQDITQTIRGRITDSETNHPLAGAVVMVFRDSTLVGGANSDENGNYRIQGVPVGKVRLTCSYIGYSERVFDQLLVTSAKEVVLMISLEERILDIQTVEISATREGEVINEMGMVSARQFSVEETDRYAGSRGDPARMASNFAGVQGADDSRNDIVIRGNSPQGVLWRFEGLDIPNPNHFAIPGTSGGPVSILNNKYLANSDFFTAAFPAEYGNTVSGVFDLRMRNGNNERHEFSGQFGFLGTELFAEGPLDRKRGSSYLVSYRYSTLELFSSLGIGIGTSAVPGYQDGAFRIHLPGKNGGSLSFWGVGGASTVDILISDQERPDERNIYGENDRDQYYRSRMAASGVTYARSFNESTYMRIAAGWSGNVQDSYHELVYRHVEDERFIVDSLTPLLDYRFSEQRFSVAPVIHHKFNKRHHLRAGVLADHYLLSFADSVRIIDTSAANYYQWQQRWGSTDGGVLLRPFVQWKYRPNDQWTITAGWYAQSFTMNQSSSWIEPRAAIRWQFHPQQSIAAGVGIHSQLQPMYMYFYRAEPTTDPINRHMGMTKSRHLVLTYAYTGKGWRFLTEVYHQYLWNIPVEAHSSSFSLVNTGAGFNRFFPGRLINAGRAENFGVEWTVERFFSKGWLFLFSASLFESVYRGSDGVVRNTDFNGRYAINALGSREWATGKRSSIVVGSKVTTAGGRWYGPADIAASERERELVFLDSARNSLQFRPYFRLDLKFNYRINRAKTTHEIGLDLVNVLNTQNVLKLTYAPDGSGDPRKAIREEYQLGFLPIFFYRIDW